jgi:WD40 repeat protein
LEATSPRNQKSYVYVTGESALEGHGLLLAIRFQEEWNLILDERALSLAVNREGTLAAAGITGKILLIDLNTRRMAGEIETIGDSWSHADFSPDGGSVASVSEEGRCSVWNVVRRQRSAVFHLPSGALGVAWAPDGKCLAVTTRDGSLMIFDLVGDPPGAPVVPSSLDQDGHSRLVCPHGRCGTIISVENGRTGAVVQCPGCGQPLRAGPPLASLPRFEAKYS